MQSQKNSRLHQGALGLQSPPGALARINLCVPLPVFHGLYFTAWDQLGKNPCENQSMCFTFVFVFVGGQVEGGRQAIRDVQASPVQDFFVAINFVPILAIFHYIS